MAAHILTAHPSIYIEQHIALYQAVCIRHPLTKQLSIYIRYCGLNRRIYKALHDWT